MVQACHLAERAPFDCPNAENQRCDYTLSFVGAAAPSVSGIIALMFQVNPELGWMDVFRILARAAIGRRTDPNVPPLGRQQFDIVEGWTRNAAQYVSAPATDGESNPGYDFHYFYGFGRVDGATAVDLAGTYRAYLPPAEQLVDSDGEWRYRGDIDAEIVEYSQDWTTASLDVTEDLRIHTVVVNVTIDHPSFHEVKDFLQGTETSPTQGRLESWSINVVGTRTD